MFAVSLLFAADRVCLYFASQSVSVSAGLSSPAHHRTRCHSVSARKVAQIIILIREIINNFHRKT